MIRKVLLSGSRARAKLLAGALKVAEFVTPTLGPGGRNGILYKAYRAPTITNDGVSIARSIVLPDEIEDLGAQVVVEAAMKTNERVGDGTTTTVELACSLIRQYAEKIEAGDRGNVLGSGGADVVEMSREILEARDLVIETLKKVARPAKKGDLKNIVATSLGKIYPEHAETIAKMIEETGKDGYIAVEDNWGTKYGVEAETILGLRFKGTYSSPYMVTTRHKEAIWEDSAVLVTNHRIETTTVLKSLIDEMMKSGRRKIVIIAEGYEREFTNAAASAIVMSLQGKGDPIKVLAVKAPTLTTEQFEDVAAYVGSFFFNKNLADGALTDANLSRLGHAKKVVVNEDDCIISGGRGDVSERIALIKSALEIEKDLAFKEQLKRRLGALQSGFGIIRVGASTEPEREYLKLKIEDAVNAAKAALEEGVVQGGGLALKKISEGFPKGSIIGNALRSPYERIQMNAGGNLTVLKEVIDPLKVVRLEVENAFSVAAQLITAEVAIAQHKKTLLEELQKSVAPASGEDDDFRSDENLDVKAYMT